MISSAMWAGASCVTPHHVARADVRDAAVGDHHRPGRIHRTLPDDRHHRRVSNHRRAHGASPDAARPSAPGRVADNSRRQGASTEAARVGRPVPARPAHRGDAAGWPCRLRGSSRPRCGDRSNKRVFGSDNPAFCSIGTGPPPPAIPFQRALKAPERGARGPKGERLKATHKALALLAPCEWPPGALHSPD